VKGQNPKGKQLGNLVGPQGSGEGTERPKGDLKGVWSKMVKVIGCKRTMGEVQPDKHDKKP